jgi:hypothetical protein
MGWDEVKMSP